MNLTTTHRSYLHIKIIKFGLKFWRMLRTNNITNVNMIMPYFQQIILQMEVVFSISSSCTNEKEESVIYIVRISTFILKNIKTVMANTNLQILIYGHLKFFVPFTLHKFSSNLFMHGEQEKFNHIQNLASMFCSI